MGPPVTQMKPCVTPKPRGAAARAAVKPRWGRGVCARGGTLLLGRDEYPSASGADGAGLPP